MEAFRVLPPLGGRPPPPAPPSPRVAPRFVQQKDSSAFVVLAEVGGGAPPSSPFRGRGFKGSASSRIPVKSAPTSPGPRTPKPLVGKSAPSSPSKATSAKRVVTAKQPPSPRKPTKPTPQSRFVSKTGQKDDPPRTIVTKTGDIDNKTIKKRNDNNDRIPNNKKSNEKTEQAVINLNEKEGRRVRQLNHENSVKKGSLEKPSAPSSVGASLSTPRGGKAAVERAAVIMDRVNRLRPERQMISSTTRPVKRNSLRSRHEAADANSKVVKNANNSKAAESFKNGKKTNTSEIKSENVVQGQDDTQNIGSVDVISPNNGNSLSKAEGAMLTKPNTNKNEIDRIDKVEPKTTSTNVDLKPQEILSENGKSSQTENSTTIATTLSPLDNTFDSFAVKGEMTNSSSMNLTTNPAGDVEDSGSTSQSSSQLTLVTGTTKVNVEPLKVTSVSGEIHSNEENKVTSQNASVNESNSKNVEKIVNSDHKEEVLIKTNVLSEMTPNGVIPNKTDTFNIHNGGENLQNKIIIMQSDKNGSVKVIGSEPVSLDMEEMLRESIVTETAVPSEELLVRKQPDLIPSTQVEEPAVTVIGQPDVEVQSGNHTVTFRFPRGHGSMEEGLRPPESTEVIFNNRKFSPEIHPVSARPKKRKNFKELCGCCRPAKRSKECSWRLPWFKKRNGPGPPPPPKVKKKGLTMPSLMSCCKCKKKTTESKPPEPKVTSQHITPSEAAPAPTSRAQTNDKRNLCRKIFCCSCKKKSPTLEPPRPVPKKKSYWRKLLCCCCSSKSSVRPRPQQSQELLKNRRKEMSKSRTTSIQSGFSKLEHSLVEHSSMMKAAIPVLPICLAWTCLILNIFIPGTGTMTSGILCLCFGKPRFSVNDTAVARLGAFCINFFIGIGQIFTIIFCLVGWGWSIWWGVIMLRLARKHRRIKMAEKASQPQTSNQNQDIEKGR